MSPPLNPIAVAVPLFFVGIAVELWLARRRGRRVYRLADALADISSGVLQQLSLLLFGGVMLAAYGAVYQRRLCSLESPAAVWIIGFFGVDFFYYWFHRASHEINVLWAGHVVHHSSEDYNLAVALRQSVLTSATAIPFYLPLALVGVPPLVYATHLALSTLYQFWIHTQLVDRLPRALEWLLNTPSHHRVHHAINPEYLDRNHGGVLMIWDRLFGTYADEVAPPRFGLTAPLGSYDAVWTQLHYVVELARASWALPRWRDKVLVWLRSPAWRWPGRPAAALVDDVPLAPRVARALVAAFAGVVVIALVLMLLSPRLPLSTLAPLVLALALGVVVIGRVVDGSARRSVAAPGRGALPSASRAHRRRAALVRR